MPKFGCYAVSIIHTKFISYIAFSILFVKATPFLWQWVKSFYFVYSLLQFWNLIKSINKNEESLTQIENQQR
ncbi:membrane protein [Candidatus Magnetomorum sp. HK-1]|nr:membrane protein [Candidatus Magnetomorum sp. HK-1]